MHKKSEYKLQYSRLNDDLRRKIWLDNIAARKSRLVTNQATHYWEYQLRDDHSCDHAYVPEEDDQEPLPPHVKKHKELREKFKQKEEDLNLGKHLANLPSAREIAVQTPEWKRDETENCNEEKLSKNMCQGPSSAKSRPSRTSRKLHTEPKRTHFVPFGWNETNTDVGHKLTYNTTAPKNQVHESAVNAAQRRKAETERFLAQEKLSRQTRQTRSREREVHASGASLPAVSEARIHPRPTAEVQMSGVSLPAASRYPRPKALLHPRPKVKEQTSRANLPDAIEASLPATVSSSSSGQWMSEYQEQFSAKSSSRSARPLSAPPAPRPVSWRRS